MEAEEAPPSLRGHPRYRVIRPLGRGGMGEVYLAVHRHLGRRVALKVIRPGLLGDAAAAARFRREMRAVARLHHPNIVAAHDAEDAGGLHFLVMEYVEGQSLFDTLQRHGPLGVAEACDCVRQAALGLQHAFEHGMTHRDVKPHNVMRTPAGQVKVLDFGLARVVAGPGSPTPSEAGLLLGTADYLAPEQASDPSAADTRSDVYSLGCTLYHLLAGAPPHPGGSLLDKVHRHQGADPAPLAAARADLPPGLAAVVARMMARRPADRFRTPAEAAAALEPYAGPGGVSVTAPPPGAPRRRRLGLVLGAAAVLLAGAGLAAVAALHWQGSGPPAAGPAPAGPAPGPGVPALLAFEHQLFWPGRTPVGTAFSPDGRVCAAWGQDGWCAWEVASGKVVGQVAGLPGVNSACFAPGGELLSSHDDGVFRRWDLAAARPLARYHAGKGWASLQGVTPSGGFCFSAHQQAVFWDARADRERFHVAAVRGGTLLAGAPLSPDGTRLLTVDALDGRGVARVFDARTGACLRKIPVRLTLDSQSWDADGRRLHLWAGDPEANQSFFVCVDAETGQELSRTPLRPMVHTSWGRLFSRDARWFAVLYPNMHLLHLYDVRTGALAGRASGPFLKWTLSFDPAGRRVACGMPGAVLVYRLDPGPPAAGGGKNPEGPPPG